MAARERKPATRKSAAKKPVASDALEPERPAPPPASRLTHALVDELCGYLRRGHYIHAACAYVGISRKSYYRWQEHGKDGRAIQTEGRTVPARLKPYLDFLDRTEIARDYGEAWLAEMTLKAAANPRDHGRWQAYMTMLERSRPDRWARKLRDPRAADPGKPATPPLIDVSKLSNEELDALEELISKAQPDTAR